MIFNHHECTSYVKTFEKNAKSLFDYERDGTVNVCICSHSIIPSSYKTRCLYSKIKP